MKILINKRIRSTLTVAVMILFVFVGTIEIAGLLSISVQSSEISSETEKESGKETEIQRSQLNQLKVTKKNPQYSQIIKNYSFALPKQFILQPIVLKTRRTITHCSLLI